MKTAIMAILLLTAAFAGPANAQRAYIGETEKWRTAHEAELKSEEGWLTVVGLFWLKAGRNTIGSGDAFDVQLTESFKSGEFGDIELKGDTARLTIADGVNATVDSKPAKTADLSFDEKAKPKIVNFGSQSFFLIKRGEKFAIRVRDTNSRSRREFTRLNWYPIDPRARVVAKFEKYATPKEVLIANVLGGSFKATSPGLLRFKLSGREFTLEPVDEEGHLFIIFRDLTSRTETYGSGRFLYADAAVDGTVVLDFNRAENPPCAFTAFATCPLPPQQNRLNIAIRAGEKRFHQ